MKTLNTEYMNQVMVQTHKNGTVDSWEGIELSGEVYAYCNGAYSPILDITGADYFTITKVILPRIDRRWHNAQNQLLEQYTEQSARYEVNRIIYWTKPAIKQEVKNWSQLKRSAVMAQLTRPVLSWGRNSANKIINALNETADPDEEARAAIEALHRMYDGLDLPADTWQTLAASFAESQDPTMIYFARYFDSRVGDSQ